MSKLTGKRILVTGGGSGIGQAVARMCLNEGAAVAIAGRAEGRLREAAASLGGGDRLVWHAADLGDADQARRLIDDVTGRLGGVDVLVNNAGMNLKEREFRQLTPQAWRQLLAGNLDGAFHCMLAVLPQM